jgi:hypothetical protein
MRTFHIIIPVIIVLLAGCAGELKMNMDPSLEANSDVLQTSSEGTFGDKRLNVTFGPYSVTEADASWVKTRMSSEKDFSLINEIFGIESPEKTKSKTTATLTYRFATGSGAPWDVACALLAHRREVFIGKLTSSKTYSARYKCRYTREGDEPRFFSVEIGESGTLIKMEADGKAYTASPVRGVFEMKGGKSYDSLSYEAGYVWTPEGGESQTAALSTMENKPRVWLHKDNSEDMNHALAMGSAGLLIYSLQIKPSL